MSTVSRTFLRISSALGAALLVLFLGEVYE
jgi:hypothetical protein